MIITTDTKAHSAWKLLLLKQKWSNQVLQLLFMVIFNSNDYADNVIRKKAVFSLLVSNYNVYNFGIIYDHSMSIISYSCSGLFTSLTQSIH